MPVFYPGVNHQEEAAADEWARTLPQAGNLRFGHVPAPKREPRPAFDRAGPREPSSKKNATAKGLRSMNSSGP